MKMVLVSSPLDKYFQRIGNVDDTQGIYIYKPCTDAELILTLIKKPQTATDYFELAQFLRMGESIFSKVTKAQQVKQQFIQHLYLDAALEGHSDAKQYLEFKAHRFWDVDKRHCYAIYYPPLLKTVYQLTKLRTHLAMHHVQMQALESHATYPRAHTLSGNFFEVTATARELKKLLASLERKIHELKRIERERSVKVAYTNATTLAHYHSPLSVNDTKATPAFLASIPRINA